MILWLPKKRAIEPTPPAVAVPVPAAVPVPVLQGQVVPEGDEPPRVLCAHCGERITLVGLDGGGPPWWYASGNSAFGLRGDQCRGNSPCGQVTDDGRPVLGPHEPSSLR